MSKGYQTLDKLKQNQDNPKHAKQCNSRNSACFEFTGKNSTNHKMNYMYSIFFMVWTHQISPFCLFVTCKCKTCWLCWIALFWMIRIVLILVQFVQCLVSLQHMTSSSINYWLKRNLIKTNNLISNSAYKSSWTLFKKRVPP